MVQYDDKLKEISEIMSKIPGDASWSKKISLVSGRQLNYYEKMEIDILEDAWKKRIKFNREVNETREKQGDSARAINIPLGIFAILGISFAVLFHVLIAALIAALPYIISFCWGRYQNYIQTRNQRYTRAIDWYDQNRFF